MFHLFRILKISLRALTRNKMRTFLTALGIIIGIASVIAMVSIGSGAKNAIRERFDSMGSNLLAVRPGSVRMQGVRTGFGGRSNLKIDDIGAIERECPAVLAVSPNINTQVQVIYLNKNWRTRVQGVSDKYPQIRKWEMEEGTFFNEEQLLGAEKVVVIGTEVRNTLFEDGEDPINKVIRLRSVPFTVIGVLKSKGQAGGMGSRDDLVCVPFTTASRRLMRRMNISSIDVQAVSSEAVPIAQQEIIELLRIRHKIQEGMPDDFQVQNMAEVAESREDAIGTMTLLLGSIAAISLLVGGIGIMNIMLVSVTERIREIGIRMSIGAREKDILMQFLAEAIVLSLTGGFLGIVLGVGLSKLLKYIPIFSRFPAVVSPGSVIMAVCFAAGVGIFFGFYPAKKASKLDPIEALRYE
jgi:putative ABC transport system permease protein